MAYSEPIAILMGRDDGQATLSAVETAALLAKFPLACDIEVLEFGVIVTEDFTAHDVDPVLTLGTMSDDDDTALDTNLVSLTLSSAATASLKAGDGVKEAQTAIAASTDIDLGDIILASPENFPLHVDGGQVLGFELTTASGSAGGEFIAFAIVRLNGLTDARKTNVWTATVKQTVAA
jgi:hypothetical protein